MSGGGFYQPADLARLRAPQSPVSRKVVFVTAEKQEHETFKKMAETLRSQACPIDARTFLYEPGVHVLLELCMRDALVVIFGKGGATEGENLGVLQLETHVAECAERCKLPVLYPTQDEPPYMVLGAILEIIGSG